MRWKFGNELCIHIDDDDADAAGKRLVADGDASAAGRAGRAGGILAIENYDAGGRKGLHGRGEGEPKGRLQIKNDGGGGGARRGGEGEGLWVEGRREGQAPWKGVWRIRLRGY